MKRFVLIALTVSLVSSVGKSNDLGHARSYAFVSIAECSASMKNVSQLLEATKIERDQALIDLKVMEGKYIDKALYLMDVESMLSGVFKEKNKLRDNYKILLETLEKHGIQVDPELLDVDFDCETVICS